MKQTFIFMLCLMSLNSLVFASPDVDAEKVESQKFIDKEVKIKGTEQLLSGLVFRSLKAGQGEFPKDSDTVTVEYKGTLRTGKVFDETAKGKSVSFPLNGVIPCWTEALKKMKVGGSAVIVCPSHIAYGDNGTGADIKGGAALKFEVKLLKISNI